jgi:hypothetical protein
VRWGQDSTPPIRWKGQHSGRRCRPSCSCFTSSRCSGGSTSAGVDTDSAACPPKTAPDTNKCARADDLNCFDDGLRPTRAGTKLNTFASEFQSAHKWVRQSQLQHSTGTSTPNCAR